MGKGGSAVSNYALSVDYNEAYRYMGAQGVPDEELLAELQAASDIVLESSEARVVSRVLPIKIEAGGVCLQSTGLCLGGRSIAALLHNCHSCVIFCATIGNAIEALLSRWQIKDLSFAAMLDACASSAAESLCEAVSDELHNEYSVQGQYLTDRFSPGYGDLPIFVQKDFCAVLDTARKIGVCVSEGGIMIPRKSVTAIIGISKYPQRHIGEGCKGCRLLSGCKFIESGVTCYGQAV